MAETKQGGFHAFEKRVHELEEEDRKAEQGKPKAEVKPPPAPAGKAERKEPPK